MFILQLFIPSTFGTHVELEIIAWLRVELFPLLELA